MTTMLHRFAKLVVACTVLLILAGSLVTSHDAGLSVPDWPTSYGWNMFTFPPSMWVANIFYEHGHRLIASTVGFLTIILATWLWLADARPWLRWFGAAALDLCFAAEGRVDAYFEKGLNLWDHAAGGLIAAEAGLLVTGLAGAPPGPDLVLAAPPALHAPLHDALVAFDAAGGP